jgi:hypothetical protein
MRRDLEDEIGSSAVVLAAETLAVVKCCGLREHAFVAVA